MERRIKLRIVGTEVKPDALGLASHLRGDIYYASDGRTAERLAGRYSEDVVPILDPELRGTRGRSRLELDGGAIVTENLSLLAGQSPDGALLVRSTGKVIQGEGPFVGSEGTLESDSRERLKPFEMSVDVTLRVESKAESGPRARPPDRI